MGVENAHLKFKTYHPLLFMISSNMMIPIRVIVSCPWALVTAVGLQPFMSSLVTFQCWYCRELFIALITFKRFFFCMYSQVSHYFLFWRESSSTNRAFKLEIVQTSLHMVVIWPFSCYSNSTYSTSSWWIMRFFVYLKLRPEHKCFTALITRKFVWFWVMSSLMIF